MKYINVIIPILFVLLLVPVQAFSQTDFDATSAETVGNFETTSQFEEIVAPTPAELPEVGVFKTYDVILNEDGSYTNQTHQPYFETEQGEFVPYRLTEDFNMIQVEISDSKLIFDKINGALTIFDGEDITVDSDSYVARTALIDSDVWTNLDVNDSPVTTTVQEDGDRVTVSFIRENVEGLFKTEYVMDNGIVKTTAYFTNYIYDDNKFAFTQTLNLPDSIITVGEPDLVNGESENVIDLTDYVGQSFNRDVLVENMDLVLKIKTLHYNAGLGFDKLWSVNVVTPTKVSLDYANVEQTQTEIGETLELDPTYTVYPTMWSGYYGKNYQTQSNCSNLSTYTGNQAGSYNGSSWGKWNNKCMWVYTSTNLGVPSGGIVSSVLIGYQTINYQGTLTGTVKHAANGLGSWGINAFQSAKTGTTLFTLQPNTTGTVNCGSCASMINGGVNQMNTVTVPPTSGGYNTGYASQQYINYQITYTVPTVPSIVSPAPVATTANGQNTVTWTTPSNGNSPILQYCVTRNNVSIMCQASGSPTTSFIDTGYYNSSGFSLGTPMVYQINTKNAIGYSGLSSVSNSVTPSTIPATPSAPVATTANGTNSISWSAPSANGSAITNYTLYANGTSLGAVGNVTSYTHSNPTLGTAYTYTVLATNANGNSAQSTASNSVTPALVPSTPVAPVATTSNGTNTVTWTAPSNNGAVVDTYNLYRNGALLSTESQITWGNTLNVTIPNSNTLTSITTGTGWTHGARTNETISSTTGGEVEFTANQDWTMVGFGKGTFNGSYTGVDYALSPASSGLKVYENGVGMGTFGTWTLGDTFKVTMDAGGLVKYWKNGTVFYTSATTATGDYSTDVVMYHINTTVNVSSMKNYANTYTDSAVALGTGYSYQVNANNSVGLTSLSGASNSVIPSTPPSTPTAPVATFVNNQSNTITWTAPSANGSAITNYQLFKNGTPLITLGNVLTHTETGITVATSNYYSVLATNGTGSSPQSANSNTILNANLPDAPQGFLAVSGSPITMSWTSAVSDATVTNYKIYRDGTLHVTVGAINSYTDSSAVAGNIYGYEVSAVSAAGEGTKSTSSTAAAVSLANAPAGVTATNGITQANVAWNASTDLGNGTTLAYKIYKNTNGGSYTLLTQPSGTGTTYTDTAVTAGDTYGYKIVTVNEAGDSPQSTPATTIIGNPPTAPLTLTTTQTVPFVHDLSWSAPTNNGGSPVTNYKVYRDGSLITTLGNVTTYQDNTMQHIAHTHSYEVSAVNAVGESPMSNASSITSWDVPSATTGVTATARAGQQNELDWTAPSSNGGSPITGYRIQSSTDNITFTDVVASTTTQPYNHTGLTVGTTYYYQISAISAVGEGTFGAASATVGDVPDAPVSLTVVPQAGMQATITITIPNDNGYAISSYTLHRSSDNFATFTVLNSQASNVIVDYPLNIGTSYQYKALATNSLGDSALSVASATALAGDVPSTPVAPGTVVATT